MKLFYSYSRFIFSSLLVLSLSVAANTDPAELQNTGLKIIEQSRDGECLVLPGVNWISYSIVQLEAATVEFRKDWKRDQRRWSDNNIRERDEIRIKTDMANLLDEVLTSEWIIKDGFTIASESGSGVLSVTPRIVELDIRAPDRVSDNIKHTLVDSQLNMRLELDIRDSVSGELLASAWQYQEDPYKGYMEEATSPSNRRAARLMLLRWLDWLRDHLLPLTDY